MIGRSNLFKFCKVSFFSFENHFGASSLLKADTRLFCGCCSAYGNFFFMGIRSKMWWNSPIILMKTAKIFDWLIKSQIFAKWAVWKPASSLLRIHYTSGLRGVLAYETNSWSNLLCIDYTVAVGVLVLKNVVNFPIILMKTQVKIFRLADQISNLCKSEFRLKAGIEFAKDTLLLRLVFSFNGNLKFFILMGFVQKK